MQNNNYVDIGSPTHEEAIADALDTADHGDGDAPPEAYSNYSYTARKKALSVPAKSSASIGQLDTVPESQTLPVPGEAAW